MTNTEHITSPEPSTPLLSESQLRTLEGAMPPDGDIAKVADVFSLLGDPGRVRILAALLGRRMRVRDLAVIVHQSESSVSHALRLLRAHQVVSVTRAGREAHYQLADAHVRSLLELALCHAGHSSYVANCNDHGSHSEHPASH